MKSRNSIRQSHETKSCLTPRAWFIAVALGVGLVDSLKSTRAVVKEFMEEFVEAISDLNALTEE